MASPFPGMDPYIEPNWLDVHTSLISEIRRSLNARLPAGLVARVEERVAVESEDPDVRTIGPDVRVFSPASADPANGAGGIVIEAPYKLVIELDPIIERFIRIIDQAGELITTIELISPTNKRHPGLAKYRQKRSELLASGVHVVEIDLIRAGDWRALMLPELCPVPAVTIYRAIIRVAGQRPGGYLFPIRLQETLPGIPIPLRPAEQPLQLPLQPLFDAVYSDGRYDKTIDYSRPLDPPLEADEHDWAANLLRTTEQS